MHYPFDKVTPFLICLWVSRYFIGAKTEIRDKSRFKSASGGFEMASDDELRLRIILEAQTVNLHQAVLFKTE